MGRKIQVTYHGVQGNVITREVPDYGFIYQVSSVIDPDRMIGDRVDLPDGRRARYAKSSAACKSGRGCETAQLGFMAATAMTIGAAIGDTEITAPAATHDAVVKDELAGGYAVIFGTADDVQFRGIVGNDAASANVAFKVRLDGGLIAAVTTNAIELYRSPYYGLRLGTDPALAKLGYPASPVSAANLYFWVIEQGVGWVAPHAATVGAHGGMGCNWRHDGSIEATEVALGATVVAEDSSQYAGNCLVGSYSGNGPLFLFK